MPASSSKHVTQGQGLDKANRSDDELLLPKHQPHRENIEGALLEVDRDAV